MTDWSAYFTRLRATSQAEAQVPPTIRHVLRVSAPPAAAERFLGLSVRKTLKRLREAGWEVTLGWSLVWQSTEFYADDSQRKPGQEQPDHRRGDLKSPARTERHWWLHASFRPLRLAVRLHWREGATPKGGRSFGFEEAICADPVGMPSELFVDYTPTGNALKQTKDEPQWAHQQRVARMKAIAERQDYQYNDGASYLNHRPVFSAWKEFDVWLSEWEAQIARIREKEAA